MNDNVRIAGLIAVLVTLVLATVPLRGQLFLNRLSLRFPAPTARDLDRGYVETRHSLGQSDLSIETNVPGHEAWSLYLATEQPFFTPVNLNKPHYHLLWKLSSEPESKYRPITLHKVQIAEGKFPRGVNINFRLRIDWNDPPAEYSTEILFVLESTRDKMKKELRTRRIEKSFR